jgi:PAS domain S-box-containing protein
MPDGVTAAPLTVAQSLSPLLAAAVEAIQDGIAISDVRQPDQPVIYVNPGFEELTGYAATEVIGRNCRFLQGAERDQDALPIVRRAIRQGESCSVILRNYRKDGRPFWNELALYPLRDAKGELTHYVGVQHDISEIVERSKRLIQTERKLGQEAAQQANSMMLLNEMSREINLAVVEEDLYRIVTQFALQIVPSNRASIALVSDDHSQVEISALQGSTGVLPLGVRMPIDQTLVGKVITSGCTLSTADLRLCEERMPVAWFRTVSSPASLHRSR